MINVSTFRIKNRSFEFLPGVCIKLNSPLGHKGSLVVHTRCAQAIRQFLVELGRRVVNHRDDAHVLCGALHARQLNSADTVHTALKPRLAYKYSAAVLQYRAELSFRCRFYRAFFFRRFDRRSSVRLFSSIIKNINNFLNIDLSIEIFLPILQRWKIIIIIIIIIIGTWSTVESSFIIGRDIFDIIIRPWIFSRLKLNWY